MAGRTPIITADITTRAHRLPNSLIVWDAPIPAQKEAAVRTPGFPE
jgi:hypothetical protein